MVTEGFRINQSSTDIDKGVNKIHRTVGKRERERERQRQRERHTQRERE